VITALIGFAIGIAIGYILAQPTRELDSKGPLVKLGQGAYRVNLKA
jgi:hypothetical protein